MPRAVIDKLHDEAVQDVARNLEQVHSFNDVAREFEARKIPWICVKGPVIAETLYDDPAVRSFRDIDVLIHQEDFTDAFSILTKIGYRPQFEIPFKWQQLFFNEHSEIAFIQADRIGTIDLHWELLPSRYSFAPRMNEIWSRAEVVEALGIPVLTLSPNDTLVFTCLHAAKHNWERLIWITDIAALLARLDHAAWGLVLNDLQEADRGISLHVGLMLSHALFKTELPKPVHQRLIENTIAWRLCRERIKRWGETPNALLDPLPWQSLFYQSMSRRGDRWRLIHDLILRPTPHEWRAIPLGYSWRSIYYVVRPFRLMWKHLVSRKVT